MTDVRKDFVITDKMIELSKTVRGKPFILKMRFPLNNCKMLVKYFLCIIEVTFIVIALFIFTHPATALTPDSLELWAKKALWGHYIPPDSLESSLFLSMARGDWNVAAHICAAISFTQFGTIDSAMYDIAYCLGKTGDFDGARDAIQRAKRIYGHSDPQTIYIQALLEMWRGNTRKAEQIVKSALRKCSDDARPFLSIAMGIVSVLSGDVSYGFEWFRRAENIRRKGTGHIWFEARIYGQMMRYDISLGTLYVRQYVGCPCVILRIKPIFKWKDGSVTSGQELSIEQIAQIFGSPYFQLNIERKGYIAIPRWSGIPAGGEADVWITYLDENGVIDSTCVALSGYVKGFPPADSFAMAIENLRCEAIQKWFDTLIVTANKIEQPFWRFIISYRLASALSDSTRWAEGISIVDSLIADAPYIDELYLWRGAFSLFEKKYEQAYSFFLIPAKHGNCAPEALYNAGVAKFLDAQYEDAESLWLAATECNNSFPPPFMALGILYQDFIRQPEKAKNYYRKYLELSNFLQYEVEQWLKDLK